MSSILAFVVSVDPLAILFVVGSLLFLWALVRVLIDDIDLSGGALSAAETQPPRTIDEKPALPPSGAIASSDPAPPAGRRPAA